MAKTSIEWATHTINFVSGCEKVSPACQHCYAERQSGRLSTMPNAPERYREGVVRKSGESFRWTGKVVFDHAAFAKQMHNLLHSNGRARVFVCSMSDLFHDDVNLGDLAMVMRYFRDLSRHTFMLLTKRPHNMVGFQRDMQALEPGWAWPANVWCGTTVENQEEADKRVPELLHVQSAVRFLSCEPLLGPVDVTWAFDPVGAACCGGGDYGGCPAGGTCVLNDWPGGDDADPYARVHWVIAGGESGPGARPMHPAWAEALRDQCDDAGVPFHFKQWGAWEPVRHGDLAEPCKRSFLIESKSDAAPWWMRRVGKKKSGRLLDGREHNDRPGSA